MLVPDFQINQNQTHLIIAIRVPYVRVTTCSFIIEENMFKFILKPYLLPLTLEQPLQKAERPERAAYYHSKHILEVVVAKKNKGEFFENLNLLSNTIEKNKEEKIKVKKKVGVQIMEDPKLQKPGNSSVYRYGLYNNFDGVFSHLENQEDLLEIFSFNPEEVANRDRCQVSFKCALEDFDDNSYLFDKISNFEEIDRICEGTAMEDALMKGTDLIQGHKKSGFNEFRMSLKLPGREIIVSKQQKEYIFKQITNIALCYTYQLICKQGKMDSESAKTISKTSSVLNCFVDFDNKNIKYAILDAVRRCIVYSSLKHLDIGMKAINFLAKYLTQELLIYIIVDLRALLSQNPPYENLNKIFLDDACLFLFSKVWEKQIREICKILSEVEISEQSLELEVDNEEMEISNNNIGDELEDLLQMI